MKNYNNRVSGTIAETSRTALRRAESVVILLLISFCLLILPSYAMISTEDMQRLHINSPEDAARMKNNDTLGEFPKLGGTFESNESSNFSTLRTSEAVDEALQIKYPSVERLINYLLLAVVVVAIVYVVYPLVFPKKKRKIAPHDITKNN